MYEFAVSAFTLAGEGDISQWLTMTPRDISIPNKMNTPVVAVSECSPAERERERETETETEILRDRERELRADKK